MPAVDTIVLEDYEMHSSRIKDFTVYAKKARPTFAGHEMPAFQEGGWLGDVPWPCVIMLGHLCESDWRSQRQFLT